MARVLTTSGLILDIVGVVVLFCFGLPPRLAMSGILALDRNTDAFQKKEKRYRTWSYAALACLVTGFLLQIIGIWTYPTPGRP